MALGRLRLGPKARELKDKQLLEEALTLFAYPNPRQAPAGYLLEDEHREELAMALQRAVRMKLGRQEISTLETVYREVKAMHEKLLESGNPTAFMVTVDEFIDQI